MITKVISGGQTGIDTLGLEVAKSLGIPTGGMMPKGWLTEVGPKPEYEKLYGMVQHKSEAYTPRTEANAMGSDGSVLFGNVKSPGCSVTLKFLNKHNKPYIINPTSGSILRDWLDKNNIKTLNVVGNRGSRLNETQLSNYRAILTKALQDEKISI